MAGTFLQVRLGVWRCIICGEVFLGLEPPVECPHCGSHHSLRSSANAYERSLRTLGAAVSATDTANVLKSVANEHYDRAYYAAIATTYASIPDVAAIFLRLSKIEAEHIEVFEKTGLVKGQQQLTPLPIVIPNTVDAIIFDSVKREVQAARDYHRFAHETENKRLRKIWRKLEHVEADHAKILEQMGMPSAHLY